MKSTDGYCQILALTGIESKLMGCMQSMMHVKDVNECGVRF